MIVDDEPGAIRVLSEDLAAYPDVCLLGTATAWERASGMVVRLRPDLLFLDVEMPGMSGIILWRSVLAELSPETRVVFYTAYDKYAVEALHAAAFDYLLKPYLPEELDAIIGRYRRSFVGEALPEGREAGRRFGIQTGSGLLLLRREDVVLFFFSESRKSWILIGPDREEHKLRTGLSARDLVGLGDSFAQVSQSHVVNLDYLRAIDNKTLECHLYPPFQDLKVIISRRYYAKVREALRIL